MSGRVSSAHFVQERDKEYIFLSLSVKMKVKKHVFFFSHETKKEKNIFILYEGTKVLYLKVIHIFLHENKGEGFIGLRAWKQKTSPKDTNK